jgi:hypothetical protein
MELTGDHRSLGCAFPPINMGGHIQEYQFGEVQPGSGRAVRQSRIDVQDLVER